MVVRNQAGDVVWEAVSKPEADVLSKALLVPSVAKHLDGRKIVRVIYKPGKVINILTESADG